jgi:phage shock protein PspC (stress-responsive transcriptional regulator)
MEKQFFKHIQRSKLKCAGLAQLIDIPPDTTRILPVLLRVVPMAFRAEQ